ncbi:ROK family transcriptional regulator [Mameliella sediminis]|uniref:ROK family transcriptional regulator n=1 Tax=Mameliella sediminis TaxID=2836866 RepID=UPI001C4726F5|nr:ROK family transcriptional regulator [Mameliella sediminis]MBV7395055.1 ROK family transcriptional regulator [Mameliella sediminis]MBY6113758.1 ROK family transcriptional regulator [Antarctobacter heliothermus]MBY6142894.1 ROK family transcriptional regulator [Mameliella alba]MCA0953381.1 ROK family transcriptional regulator [Mameliella alba]
MKLDTTKGEGEGAAGPPDSVRGSNQSGVRAHNERLVLSLVRQYGPLAKAEIARRTGLSAQTVSVIMRALEKDGLLEKGEPVRGKVGQPSVPMGLARNGAFFLGLKVGRRSLDLILTDFHGHVEGRVHLSHRYPTPDSVVRFANIAITQLLDQMTPQNRARVAGLGIAIPFRLWDWAGPLGLAADEMEAWRDRDIATEIADAWDFPVYMRNDGSAACGAELVFGDQNKPRDFLYFFVGFFVGGGLVIDNTVFTGRSGNAAALASLPIGIRGAKVRQLVDVASIYTLEQLVLEAGGDSGMIWDDPSQWSLPDGVLDDWIAKATEGLAYAILSASCLIDFESVVIDGWLPEPVRAALVAQTARRLNEIRVAGIEVPDLREGSIGRDARALGAASLALSDRFLVDRNAFLKT